MRFIFVIINVFFLISLNLSYQDFVFIALEVSLLKLPASRISFFFLLFYASVIVYFF